MEGASATTIVIVEDEAAIADALAARLRAEGFAVEVAHGGLAGVELCARVAPDLVALDVMLPGPGVVVTREQLLEEVWGFADGTTGARTVDSHVAAIRRKLGADALRTVQGIGYAFGTPEP